MTESGAATRTIEDLEKQVEEIDEEMAELTGRRDEATATKNRAERRFEELAERRTALSPKAFSGDAQAQLELEGLEDEHDALARSVRVAEAALPEFERMLSEARARRAAARESVYRKQAVLIEDELRAVSEKREELAEELKNLLEEYGRLFNDKSQIVRLFDQDAANSMAQAAGSLHRRWFESTFGTWLR